MNAKFILAALIMVALVSAPLISHDLWARSKADKKAEKTIEKALEKYVNKKYSKYCDVSASTKDNPDLTSVYHKDCTPPPPPPPVNQPPIASIVVNSTAHVGDTVQVNGNNSMDVDGTIVKYLWSGAPFANSSASSTTFVFPNASQVTISLTVTDNNGSTGSVSATVRNAVVPPPPNVPPVVNAGADLTVKPNTTVTLTGTASDSDGSLLSVVWTQTSGPIVNLTSEDPIATFNSPLTTTTLTLVFTLTATDNQGASSSDSMTVTVKPEVIPPPPPPPPPGTVPDLNTATTKRVAIFGDIDNNNGLVTQLNLMVKYHVQYLLLAGDYAYTDGPAVLTKLTDHGFNKSNTQISVGNHNGCSAVRAWLGESACFGLRTLDPSGKIDVITLDANSGFGCSGTQFNTIQSDVQSSDAWYKIALIHQPFVTVKSTHGANGAFNCYHALFKANGVNLVAQAHNHNYQKEVVDSIIYGVYGTGTHDTGSKMYPCNSKTDQNGVSALCITGTNGFTILDLKINDPNTRQINGYFVSNSDKVMDTFTN